MILTLVLSLLPPKAPKSQQTLHLNPHAECEADQMKG